jgi:hypothetical protein
MAATRFERPAVSLFAAVSLAGMIAAFAIGQVRAQPVTPPVPPPNPTFNPSGPSTVPQAPYVPVSPAPPSGLSGSAPAPVSPDIAPPVPTPPPPAVTPPPVVTPPPAVTPPAAVTPQAATAPETPVLSRTHARYHGPARRWSRHHVRFHARVVGPSYYPGLGEFYPPYADPCHFRRVWQGYYAPYWTYACGW